jgi:hypothetical protein
MKMKKAAVARGLFLFRCSEDYSLRLPTKDRISWNMLMKFR